MLAQGRQVPGVKGFSPDQVPNVPAVAWVSVFHGPRQLHRNLAS